MWNVKKIVSKGDYNYAVCKNHPYATSKGYVLEHRVVIENHLGRLLGANEVVHHINGNKKDNRIENLEVMTRSNHTRKHMLSVGEAMVVAQCPYCKIVFTRAKNKTHLIKGGIASFCSLPCSGKFHHGGEYPKGTIQMKKAISGNILHEYREYKDNPEQTI